MSLDAAAKATQRLSSQGQVVARAATGERPKSFPLTPMAFASGIAPQHAMKTLFSLLFALAMIATASAADKDPRCYEMRIYYAAPGKLDALNARFRDHTCKLFLKHGMENIGYWMPLENPDRKLIYVLAYPSREARDKSWKGFMADPDWKAAHKASEANGKLVDKLESIFLEATDYSPAIAPKLVSPARTFELRTYTASAGNLGALNARFRDHTVKLFSKHGMEHVGYWTLSDAKAKGADNTLIYILAHQSPQAATNSFGTFRKDPDWIAARSESEKKAGGSLTEGGMAGVKSVLMQPTDYSQTK